MIYRKVYNLPKALKSLISGQYFEVDVNGDEITLRKTTPPEIKEKVSLEEKVRMLDKKQRAKLANLIDKL